MSETVLTYKEWIKKYVVKWQGIKNSDTKTVEGGYLWLRQEDGSEVGFQTHNVSNRKEAIDFHYGRYLNSLVPPPKTFTKRLNEVLDKTTEELPPSND